MRARTAAVLITVLIVANLTSVSTALEQPMALHGTSAVTDAVRHDVEQTLERSSLLFVPNGGQHPAEVSFTAMGTSPGLFFTPNGVTYSLLEEQKASEISDLRDLTDPLALAERAPRRGWAVRQEFLGARATTPIGTGIAPGKVNYLRGPITEHVTDLATYAGITYPGLWDGIDLHYKGNDGALKYEFHLAPGADPSRIRLAYRGAKTVTLTQSGAIKIKTPVGSFTDAAPIAWQDGPAGRVPVKVAYLPQSTADKGFIFGFALGDYDPALPLVIDPAVLVYSTFLGGSGYDEGRGIAVDAAGAAYVTGRTESADFPSTVGAFDPGHDGGGDAFVTKITPTGTGALDIVYSTYLGGSDFDQGNGIAVDGAGAAYVTGETASVDFPTTAGAFDGTFNSGGDAFLAKITPSGGALAYSTYLGGSGLDFGFGIAVDAAGAAYVNGATDSADFPTTAGAFDSTFNGIGDAFVTKITPTGGALAYSTYLGGSDLEFGFGMAVDTAGAAYVTGRTESGNFPTTTGAFDTGFNGGGDAFVTKITPTGGTLAYSTYLGGSGFDQGVGIAVDAAGAAYVTGVTGSGDFPTTTGAFDTGFNGGLDAFVSKITPTGGTLAYSTYLGGAGFDAGDGIAVDAAGAAYVTGVTGSGDFPTTPGALDTGFNGGGDAFVSKITPTGGALAYSTYLGGTGSDAGFGIAVDAAGAAYVTGRTDSGDFPTTTGAFDTGLGSFSDAFVSKFAEPGADLSLTKAASDDRVDRGEHLTYTITVSNAGPSDATGVTVTDTLPEEVAFESATPSQGTCAVAAGTVTCALGTIAAGDSATIEIEVDAYHAGTTVNSACVEAAEEDPDPDNNCDSATVKIRNVADLELAKTASPDPAMVGEPLTYTLTIHNQGPSEAKDAVLVDHLPASVEFVSASSTQGSCTESAGTVTCDLGDIEDDDTVTVTIHVVPTQAGQITNTASVDSDTRDDDDDDNDARLTTTVVEPANLSVAASASSPAYAGEPLTYNITVSNAGAFDATDVLVTDTLPGGVDLVTASASQGSCDGARCTLGTIANGQQAAIQITVRPHADGEYANTAEVSSSSLDPAPEDNAATTTATVDPAADLGITAHASAGQVDAGDELTYLIEVTNAGPSTARQVTLTDPLPDGYRITGWAPSQGECSLSDSTLTCALADLASGDSATIRIEGIAERPGTYPNTPQVRADTHDTHPADNSALAETVAADVTDPVVTLTRALPGHLYIEAAGLDVDLGAALQHAIIATPITEFELRADATDEFELERVDFYVDDVRVCSDYVAPYTCAWVPMLSSLARVEVEAVDAWGNTSARDGVDVLVGM